MSILNPTTGERMAVIENEVKGIKEENKLQSSLLNKIDTKLDHIFETKADKDEVLILRQKVNKITWQIMTGLIITLATITAFLIKFTLFNT